MTNKTSIDLRQTLFDELDKLSKGKSDYKHANAVAKMSSEIINTVRAEIEAAKYMHDYDVKSLATPLKLTRK